MQDGKKDDLQFGITHVPICTSSPLNEDQELEQTERTLHCVCPDLAKCTLVWT